MTERTATFREGVEAQPQNLEQGAELLQSALVNADLGPLRDGTIVFSGIGASWHAGTVSPSQGHCAAHACACTLL